MLGPITNTKIIGNEIAHMANFAPYSRGASELDWPAAITLHPDVSGIVIRNNKVYENWGEGFHGGNGAGADDILIEDNQFFDNYAGQLYLHGIQNVTVRNNLVYHTNNSKYYRGSRPSDCIIIYGLEPQYISKGYPASSASRNIDVYNNMIYGCSNNVAFWGNQNIPLLKNITIYHNTSVNSRGASDEGNLLLAWDGSANFENISIANNIFYQDSGNIAVSRTVSGVSFRNNIWSKSAPSNVLGSGSLNATNPQLTSTPSSISAGQALNPDWFKIKSSSPAIDRGAVTDFDSDGVRDVPTDFFGANRGSRPDMGAHEFGGTANTSTPTEIPNTNTPTDIPIRTADLDSDGDVDIFDYNALVGNFGRTGSAGFIPADIDADGDVDIFDYNTLVGEFGR